MSILDLLLPKEGEFFNYMNDQMDNFHEACIFFSKFMLRIDKLSKKEILDYINKIKEYELKGDKIERYIIRELDITFITPLDREDIHSIVINIDNCLDFLNSISQKIDIYKIRKTPPDIVKFLNIITEMSEKLKRLIHSLKNRKEIFLQIREIHKLENDADHFFHKTVAKLFRNKNSVEIIKFKDIYQELENLCNSMDSVSKIVRGIVVKQG